MTTYDGMKVNSEIPSGNLSLESVSTNEFLSLIGSRVRKQRNNIGLTRKALATRSGVSERYLTQLELGKSNISILLLRKVANAIGIKLNDLMTEERLKPVTNFNKPPTHSIN